MGIAFGSDHGFNELGLRLPYHTLVTVDALKLGSIRKAAKLVDAITWANTGQDWLDRKMGDNLRGLRPDIDQCGVGNVSFQALYSPNIRARDNYRRDLVKLGLEDDI